MRIAAVRLSWSGSRWLTFDDPVRPDAIGTVIERPRRSRRRKAPPQLLANVEARRKIPVADYQVVADEYATTDISMEELGARYGTTRERIRQIIAKIDPAIPDRRKAQRQRAKAEQEANEVWTKFWKRCASALAENRRCKTCNGWIIQNKKLTCSTECFEAWLILRIFDDPDDHRRSMAKVILRSPDKYPEVKLNWARRMLGPNPPERNRVYLVPGSKRAEVIKKYRPEAYAELVSR